MNKYFTKEYIKECDCEEIQGLKKKIDNYDWASEKKKYKATRLVADWEEDLKFFVNDRRKEYIWLPTEDQLNEEIIKICKKKRYEYAIFFSEEIWIASIEPIRSIMNGTKAKEFQDGNPLIVKIRLLKELLNE